MQLLVLFWVLKMIFLWLEDLQSEVPRLLSLPIKEHLMGAEIKGLMRVGSRGADPRRSAGR